MGDLYTTIIPEMSKILVVDDSDLICQVTKEYLKPLGHEVDAANSGSAAVSAIEKHTPQLVIMDVQLPDSSGFDVCRAMREKGYANPILMSSASDAYGPWVHQLAQGFLFKPYTEDVLRSKVKALLESPPEPVAPEPHNLSWDSSVTFVHHLRNSIGCVSGLLDMFRIKRDDKAFQDQFINLVQQAVNSSIVFLDEFSQLRYPLELKRETIRPDLWLNNIVLNHPISKDSRVVVRWQMDTGSLSPMSGDPAQLTRAINAVLENAVEAMPQGGTLTIGAYGDVKKRWNYFMFQDTGVGMDEYVVEHSFIPFFTMKNNKRGIGLSWAQKIVKEHAGDIELSSTLGKGTSVLIKLPTKAPVKK